MRPKFYRQKNGVTRIKRASYGGGRYSSSWRSISSKVIERDNHRCRKCGKHETECRELGLSMEVDHIRPVSRGGTDDITNLQYLCSDCHSKRPRHSHLRK